MLKPLTSKFVGEMYLAVAGFVRSHGGACEVYIPPYAVYLNADNSIYPDFRIRLADVV